MRVAFFIPGALATVTGGYGYDRQVIAGLRAAGHSVDVVELGSDDPLADAGLARRARAAWAVLPADALPVIDSLALHGFAPLAAELRARRSVGLVHHPVSLEPEWDDAARRHLRDAEATLFPAFDRVIVTSPWTAHAVADGFGVDPARLCTVVPGTDPAPRCRGSGGPTCRILAIGSLIPRKGHDLLLRALARLPDLDWHLTIAGGPLDGACAATLRALADELGIAARVAFPGTVTGAPLQALWQETDLFALATGFEGYGMAIAEALRRGIPVAITRGGAAGELVSPDVGVACDVGDLVTFAKALRRAVFDVSLRAEMAEAAWQFGQTLPDWPTQQAAFIAALAP